MTEKKRLTPKQFELLRPRYQGHEENVIGMLLDHIDVAEAELKNYQGYVAFLRSCALSGEQPETYEWYLQKEAEIRKEQ